MRRPSQDARLPPIIVQVFGLLVATAMAVYAISEESTEVALACLTFAAGCVGFSLYDRAREEVERAMVPPRDDKDERESS